MAPRKKPREYGTATIKVEWPLDIGMEVTDVIGMDRQRLAHLLRVLSVKVNAKRIVLRHD